uniref:Uncharacterized protein n=1 Tax=Peronospora matthiolae TaxID=2874970 RepID=A0AAV1UW12_9STRA
MRTPGAFLGKYDHDEALPKKHAFVPHQVTTLGIADVCSCLSWSLLLFGALHLLVQTLAVVCV